MKQLKIALLGYGKMGKEIEKTALERKHSILAVIDNEQDWQEKASLLAQADVAIDFSTPSAAPGNIERCFQHHLPIVVGTTGWNDIRDEVISYFEKCGTVMIYASNFSVGVNVMFAAVDKVSSLLGSAGGYSPYMIEMHHCHKLDAPSGTAKSLAEIVDSNMGSRTEIQSVRCGEIPGIHIVGFEGVNDRIRLEHEAFSREGFASGAVLAAIKAESLTGVHEFKDIIL